MRRTRGECSGGPLVSQFNCVIIQPLKHYDCQLHLNKMTSRCVHQCNLTPVSPSSSQHTRTCLSVSSQLPRPTLGHDCMLVRVNYFFGSTSYHKILSSTLVTSIDNSGVLD
ncbi:hypothetical protein KC19_5G149800 [Ceratodon purpureus]|uniref:Uncharacterized protein n=1 Tax=Ceratodon purpureus TaxID=3225 RepID=A0A8T0I327_CERPU|nr:hypothetical protein KC19_5G149800 [Ceratodon purpureus]